MIAHAIKLFEDKCRVASFWYIKRCKGKELDDFSEKNNIDLSSIEIIRDSLEHIRNKTHFHIDRNAVKNTDQIWKEAKITGKQLAEAIDNTFIILKYLYNLETGEEFYIPEYDGSDATKIAKYAKSLNKNL